MLVLSTAAIFLQKYLFFRNHSLNLCHFAYFKC